MSETKSRKYLLTINNPEEHGIDHDTIKTTLETKFKIVYYCLADEIGLESKTPHTHIFFYVKNPIRFSTVKQAFPSAHIDKSFGTSEENRAYVQKSGKWASDKKADTVVPDTFEEYGKCPNSILESQKMNQMEEAYEMIKAGASDYEIINSFPSLMRVLRDFDSVRQMLRYESYKTTYRELSVTYRYGAPGVGKTRAIMEMYGYENVYRVTDYNHAFDGYRGQDVVLFDEFRSSLPIADMLKYLEGYPLELPARYGNKVAVYTTVYIVSNIPLGMQYPNTQSDEPVTYKAFCRRIQIVQKVYNDGQMRPISLDLATAGFDTEDNNPFI